MLDETQVSFLKKVSCVKFGYWTLLTQEQSVNDSETNRTLEPLVFDLLLYFIIHSDRIISRQELVDNVWKQNYVDDNAINRAISELRKALKSEKQIGRIVKTHYRTGYSFMLPVELEYFPDKLGSSEQEATTTEVNPSEYLTSSSLSEASDNQLILQSQAVTAPLASKQPSTTHTKIPQKKYQSWYSMVLLFLLLGSIAYLGYYSLKAEIPSTLKSKPSPQPLPLSFSEEILSWDQGFVKVIKLSKDKQLLAYSFENLIETDYALHIKDLQSLKLYKVLSGSKDPIYPIAWSAEHTLVYQILNPANEKCEVWQVEFSQPKLNNDHTKLFDCESTEIISADIATADNQLIYTKYNYRGREKLSALVSKDLNNGKEFQITSPNSERRGDFYVTLSTDQQQVAFLRSQQLKTEIFIANRDGSEQIKLHSTDYLVFTLHFNNSNTELIWLNSHTDSLVTFNLETKKLSHEYLDTSHNLRQRFKTEISNNNHIITATYNESINIDKLEINNATPKLTSYLNSPHYEGFVAPFNLSDASIFVSVNIETTGFWLFKDGIRKKLFDTNIKSISGVSLSPDDSMFLIATHNKLFIYDTQDYTLVKETLLPGTIRQASWPLADKLLLTYTEGSNTTFAWLYQWQQEKLFKLTNHYTESAKLISKDTLLFLNDKVQLIQKNIDSGESKPLVTLSDKTGVVWTADKNNIFYVKNTNDKYIRKISLNNFEKEVQYAVPPNRKIWDLVLRNNADNSILYTFYSQINNNHIIGLKVKN